MQTLRAGLLSLAYRRYCESHRHLLQKILYHRYIVPSVRAATLVCRDFHAIYGAIQKGAFAGLWLDLPMSLSHFLYLLGV